LSCGGIFSLKTIEEAERDLLGPGGLFELGVGSVLGEEMLVMTRRLPSLRAMLELSRGYGAAEYLVCESTRLTFADHFLRVASVARALRDRFGVAKGDRVAILAENGPEWILTFWATVSLGAVAVGLNGWWVRDEILYALEDADPKVLVADDKRLARLTADDVRVPIVRIEQDFDATTSVVATSLPETPIDEDDPACILYTSGTTGRPKGAVGSHRSLIGLTALQFFHGLRVAMSSPPPLVPALPPCQLVTNPLFHVSGLYTGAVAMLAGGVKTVWTKGRFDPEKILDLIEREKVTSWSPMGTMAYRVVTYPNLDRHDLSSIRNIGSGGAPMRSELQDAIRRVFPNASTSLGLGYGLTESGALATIAFGDELAARPTSAGRPMPTVSIEIRDPSGRPLPDGEEGEVFIRSPLVMLEYWRRPEDTAQTLLPGRWLRTGDIGRMESGHLYIESRKRDLILRGGENVYPIEIELCLEAHPDVVEAAVVGVPDLEFGQAVKAIVVLRDGAMPDSENLRLWVAGKLAYYKVPAHWEIRRSALPRNATGKVMKQVLLGEVRDPFESA
jgi:acyl-CoA synthetase (AMP-forming)/AMP-acid ligase II